MKFKEERFHDVYSEMKPLLEKHYLEIAHYQDIPLNVAESQYRQLQDMGVLKTFTARDEENALVGYALFFVKHNMHYYTSLQAVQDVLYIDKDRRGFGVKFIQWCDEQLRLAGVQAVYHHVKEKHNFGKLLNRIGYDLVDLIYAKRLD